MGQRGYNDTGITAIVEACGVPKGSFYYYFASKEDFGLAVIDDFGAHHNQHLDEILQDEAATPLRRIRRFFEAGLADMVAYDFTRGCPIGNLAQELAAQNEVFRKRLDAVFDYWRNSFAECLLQAQLVGELESGQNTTQLAEFLLAGWEGATLRAKVARSLAPMEAFVEICFAQVLRGPTP